MTKADLIEGLANKLGLNKGEAERAAVSTRQARTGRNPKTGESIQITASRSAKFKAGKQLKDSLNEILGGSQPSAPTA